MSGHVAVIPVFNEAPTIGALVARAACHGPVLVVDDGSSDGSADAAAAAGAAVLRLARRRGKGGALRAGFAEALSRGAERVLTLDGDGQHDPDDIPKLLAASAALPGTLVIGSRLVDGGASMEPARLKAMRVAGFFINWLVGRAVADTQSGFRVYPRKLLETVRPRRGGFVLESEMLLRAAAAGFAIREVPVTLVLEAERPSHFRPFQDGTAVATYLIWCGILPLGAGCGNRRGGAPEAVHPRAHQAASPRDAPLRGAVPLTTTERMRWRWVRSCSTASPRAGGAGGGTRGPVSCAAPPWQPRPCPCWRRRGRCRGRSGSDGSRALTSSRPSCGGCFHRSCWPHRCRAPRGPSQRRRTMTSSSWAAGRPARRPRPSSPAGACAWRWRSARSSRAFTSANRSCPP